MIGCGGPLQRSPPPTTRPPSLPRSVVPKATTARRCRGHTVQHSDQQQCSDKASGKASRIDYPMPPTFWGGTKVTGWVQGEFAHHFVDPIGGVTDPSVDTCKKKTRKPSEGDGRGVSDGRDGMSSTKSSKEYCVAVCVSCRTHKRTHTHTHTHTQYDVPGKSGSAHSIPQETSPTKTSSRHDAVLAIRMGLPLS